jgi:hypothetical protein
MSDNHTGLPHDLPGRKVKVFKALNGRWYWGHACPPGGYSSGPTIARNEIDPPKTGCRSWEQAFRHAQAHAWRCV